MNDEKVKGKGRPAVSRTSVVVAVAALAVVACSALSWAAGQRAGEQYVLDQRLQMSDDLHRAEWTYTENPGHDGRLTPCYVVSAPVGDGSASAELCDEDGVNYYHGTH